MSKMNLFRWPFKMPHDSFGKVSELILFATAALPSFGQHTLRRIAKLVRVRSASLHAGFSAGCQGVFNAADATRRNRASYLLQTISGFSHS
eukprot:COSAG05_NODE_1394_length_4994_cov_33.750358_1_plen_91_part_00